jgi:hypothetical protein
MAVGEFTPATVRLVFFDRDRERCFRCLRPLQWHERGFGWSLHHRRPRGMGGSKDPMVNSPANALTLCGHATSPTGCHHWAEKNRDVAFELGYLIPGTARTDEYRPERVRVRRLSGGWWLLTVDGRAVEVEGNS